MPIHVVVLNTSDADGLQIRDCITDAFADLKSESGTRRGLKISGSKYFTQTTADAKTHAA